LEERIKEELEENPALEMESESAEDEYELSENSEMEGDSSEEDEYGSEELDAPDVSERLQTTR
jgi:RNA polymerase sigma-54 factor